MKTQISNLINGYANVRRDETNAKYATAAPATAPFSKYAGSPTNLRESTYCFTTFMLHVLQKVKSRKYRFVIFIASFIVFLYVFLLLITSFLR